MQIIAREVSLKLRFLSCLGAVLIVFLHSYYKPFAEDASLSVCWVQEFVCQVATRFIVPYFFVVSGFFLYKDFSLDKQWYLRLLVKRSISLLMPYFFWVAVAFAWTSKLFFRIPVEWECTSLIWWLENLGVISHPPMMYHLWYVRVLIISVIISPLLGVMLLKLGIVVPIVGFLMTLCPAIPFDISQCACYLSLGAYLAIYGVERFSNIINSIFGYRVFLAVMLILLYALSTYINIERPEYSTYSKILVRWSIPIALFVWWSIFPRCSCAYSPKFYTSAFFIYCAHGLFWSVAEHFAIFIDGNVISSKLIYWSVRPVFLIVSLVFVYQLLNFFLPRRMLVPICGGR